MPAGSGPSYGRAAMLGVLIALLLLIAAGMYVYVDRFGAQSLHGGLTLADPAAEAQRQARIVILLTILLISALLILLFVIGCYLVIRVGRLVRSPLGGKSTPYVDAWTQYRLTDEEIAAATTEGPDEPPDRGTPPGLPPGARPAGPPPAEG